MHRDLFNIEFIKKYISERKIYWTKHCLNRLSQRDIQVFDVKIAENIERIVNQLKQLSAKVTIVNYKEKVA